MGLTVCCPNCSLRFTVPEELGRPKKVRCPTCDAVCETRPQGGETPAQPSRSKASSPHVRAARTQLHARADDEVPTAGVEADSTDAPPRKPRRVSVSAPPPLPPVKDSRVAGTHEDDDQPYPVPRDPQQKEPCPHCRKSVAPGTIVCNHCGFDRQTNTILKRAYEKVAREWEPWLPFRTRFNVYLTLATLTLMSMLIFGTIDGGLDRLMLVWLAGALLMAFLLGTFPRILLTRSKKGVVKLSKTWRFCFIPSNPILIDWRGHEGVSVTTFHRNGFTDWLVLIFLILPGVVPAILWWIYVIQADQFDVALTRDHGTPSVLLLRVRNEAMARDLAASLRNVTDLG